MNKLLAQQIHAKKRNEDEFTWTVIGNAQSQIPYLNNGTGHSLTDICYNYLLTHFSDLGPQDYEKLIPEIKVKLIDFIARKRLVQDHILEGLCCHQLETLHLISCPPNLTDKGLEIIALKCPNLIDFRLSSCPSVTNVGVRLIAEHCTQLKHLNLTWSSFYDNDLLPILPLITNLKSLILRRCVNLTGKTSNYIANHFSQLEVFGWNDHVDENNIIEVIKTNPIKQLDISWSSKVTDKTIEAIIEYCGTYITSLNLEICYQLTDNSIIQLVKKCTNIRHLILRNCESITDNGISIVARQCPLLHTLNIAGLHLLTDSSICNIATYCSQLERINLMGLRLITDISIDKLIEHCVDLYQVDTNNCDKITQAARLKLQEKDVSKKSAMELRW